MNEMRCFLKTKEGQEIVKKQESKRLYERDPKAIYQDHFVAVSSKNLLLFFILSLK